MFVGGIGTQFAGRSSYCGKFFISISTKIRFGKCCRTHSVSSLPCNLCKSDSCNSHPRTRHLACVYTPCSFNFLVCPLQLLVNGSGSYGNHRSAKLNFGSGRELKISKCFRKIRFKTKATSGCHLILHNLQIDNAMGDHSTAVAKKGFRRFFVCGNVDEAMGFSS